MKENSKFVFRSRQVWTIVSVALFACIGAVRELGVGLPLGLESAVDGFVQALIGTAAAGLGLWSLKRPDNATLTLLPDSKNTPVGKTTVVTGVILLLTLLFVAGARAADPECEHMCLTPDPPGQVYDVVDGNISICTPCTSAQGNLLPSDMAIDSCTIDFGSGSSYTTAGPHGQAEVVVTPVTANMEFDHPITLWCTADGIGGATVAHTARFPFSGPGSPGLPR